MADALFSTGPIEQEPGVDQLRLKVLNNSNVTATATATVFNLDGTKLVFAVRNFTLAANSSAFAFVNIPALGEFEVQFRTSNPQVLVAVFAAKTIQGVFSAANSVRHQEMVVLAT